MGLIALAVVLLGSAAFGLWWRARDGRMRPVAAVPSSPAADPGAGAAVEPGAGVFAGLGVDPAAAPVTLVQFSSAFCAPCRATRRVLAQVSELLPAVRHVEVDAEQHLDAVRALGILRTPTVLVVDRTGAVVTRASGRPTKAAVIAAVAPYLPA